MQGSEPHFEHNMSTSAFYQSSLPATACSGKGRVRQRQSGVVSAWCEMLSKHLGCLSVP